MNEKKTLLETSFKDSLGEGRFEVEITEHTGNIVLGDCVQVKIEHDQHEDLCFYETFDKENFPANFFDALPGDWGFVSEKIKSLLEERKVRDFGGWELWLKGDDYAAICPAGEKPDFDEYSVPYLVAEWNRKTGDALEEDFFQGI